MREERPGQQRPVASLGSGQFFGEMALLTGKQRSASVVAETDLDVLTLDREALRQVVERDADTAGSLSTVDGPPAATRLRAARHDAWLRTVRSPCHALLASRHAVRSIDVLGRPIHDDDPANLLRLTELARRTASEYGIEVRISHVGERPVLHFLMTGPVD